MPDDTKKLSYTSHAANTGSLRSQDTRHSRILKYSELTNKGYFENFTI
jgi:hypothetical protein